MSYGYQYEYDEYNVYNYGDVSTRNLIDLFMGVANNMDNNLS